MTKLCKDCEYFRERFSLCVSPNNGVSPVDGEPKAMFATERRSPGKPIWESEPMRCGLDAVNFKPKIKKKQKTLMSRIFDYFN